MRRTPTKQIDGDVAVGRNIAAGGDANVQGSARVGHDLIVEGYLVAKNIKSPCKGLFKTAAILKECFPRPHDGWWAMVGTSVPASVYVAEGGEWVATGGVAPTKEGMDIYTQSLENEKGKAGGIAPLDASAKVPLANLPLRTVEVAVFHSFVHVGAILNITSEHKSTDNDYGAIYDPERKRFYLMGIRQQNPNIDVTLIKAYGYWADEDIFGAEPAEGYGREPVGFKLYRCATDGGLYYWDGTDLVDFNKEVNDALDLHKDDINNLENEVENIKTASTELSDTVSTLQDDCRDTASDVSALKAAIEIRCDDLLKGGTWTWGLAATKPTDIKAGRRIKLHYGDDADTDIEGVVLSVETGKNQFEVAVYDGATKSAGMLVLVFTIGTTAKTMTAKRLVESTDARLKHIYDVQFTYDADGAKSTWNAGVEAGVVRQGDELRWLEGENGWIYDVFATVVGETNRDLCAVYFMEEEQQQTLRVIWLCYDGSVLETTFDSADVISNALNKKQDSLIDSDDITVGTNNKLSLTEKHVRKIHTITLTRVADLRYSWSGAALGDIRQGDILTWTDTDEMFRAVVFGERTSGARREVCAMFTRDGDQAIEFSLLWLYENGKAYETVFDSSQTLAGQFAACQNKLTDTADIQVRAEARPSGQHYTPYGLYLKDSAKRAVFNDMFNLAAGSDGGYKPSEAPDPAKPYLLNTLWLSYEEVEREMLDYTSIITFWKRAIRRSGPNVFCIGSFDETTRTGTLNGISGLSLSEMTDILLAGNPTAAGAAYHFAFNPFIRTNLWQMWYMDGTVVGQKCFYKCANIEVACASYLRVGTDTFSHCPKLHTIIGPLYGDGNNPAPFRGCASLVNLPGFGWNGNLDISDSPLLSLASVSALIDKGKEGATITVHADVFAKLTGDCDGVTMVITAPTTRDKSAVPIVIANPGMFAVSDILTAPVITGDDGLPLRLTVTAVDAEGQPSVAPINAGALGGLSGCNIMLADSEPAQWAAVLNAAYAKNISFATD